MSLLALGTITRNERQYVSLELLQHAALLCTAPVAAMNCISLLLRGVGDLN